MIPSRSSIASVHRKINHSAGATSAIGKSTVERGFTQIGQERYMTRASADNVRKLFGDFAEGRISVQRDKELGLVALLPPTSPQLVDSE